MREDGKRDSGGEMGDLRLLRLSAPACLYNKILVNIKIHFVNSLTLCLDEFNRCFDVIVAASFCSSRIRYVCLFPSLGDLIIDMILFRTVREIEILMGQIVHYKRTVYIAFKEYFIF